MQSPDFPFDAVLFDLDGTLVATDRFWPDAARAGALRAFEALSLERELPTSEQWMSMVGLPLEQGFDQVFDDLDPEQRKVVMDACVEEEDKLLKEGRMGLLPGVQATLQELQDRGVAIGVASNCPQSYLDTMMEAGGLSRWVQEARCLQSPGIRNKADMIEELLIIFQTRSAVMVGDRAGDRLAAWANGLPHVHLTRGYADRGEGRGAEAMLPGMDGLIPRLLMRKAWIASLLDSLCLGGDSGVLLILGPMGAGKTILARDLVRALEARGQAAQRVDAAALFADSLQSLKPEELEDGDRVLATVPREPLQAALGDAVPGWKVVHGAFLQQPWVLRLADRVLHVSTSPEVRARRVHGGALQDRYPRLHREWILGPGAELSGALEKRFPAETIAHVRVCGDNPLGDEPGASAGQSD
ncbi:MAG: HAD hydrolase-like protein [Planctomycetes bacterium]|nr:HAD hydrolase-like protein [Planctomycetota bacterium]